MLRLQRMMDRVMQLLLCASEMSVKGRILGMISGSKQVEEGALGNPLEHCWEVLSAVVFPVCSPPSLHFRTLIW